MGAPVAQTTLAGLGFMPVPHPLDVLVRVLVWSSIGWFRTIRPALAARAARAQDSTRARQPRRVHDCSKNEVIPPVFDRIASLSEIVSGPAHVRPVVLPFSAARARLTSRRAS